MARALGGFIMHGATIVHEFRDAVISKGHLFTWKAALSVANSHAPALANGQLTRHDQGVLASTMLGAKFFGHWMHDDLPLMLAARDLGNPISVLKHLTQGQQEYLQVLGLSPTVEQDAVFKTLLVVDDASQNDFKLERYRSLRTLASRVAAPALRSGVMLLRGSTGVRRTLLNESAVAQRVLSRGWKVVDPSRASATEIIDACSEASMILGVEGSQLCNGLMWMSRTGALVVIQPPERFAMVLKNQCDNLGIDYAFVVADARAAGAFEVDLEALDRMLDTVSARVEARQNLPTSRCDLS